MTTTRPATHTHAHTQCNILYSIVLVHYLTHPFHYTDYLSIYISKCLTITGWQQNTIKNTRKEQKTKERKYRKKPGLLLLPAGIIFPDDPQDALPRSTSIYLLFLLPPFLHLPSYILSKACSKSAHKSSTFSTPHENLIKLSRIPKAALLSGPWSQ